MTVCIAASCESAKKIVIAADRMLTFMHPTNLEFETDETKIEELSPSCVALVSGNNPYAMELLEKSRKKIGGNPSIEIEQVFTIVKNNYIETRMEKIDTSIIRTNLGPDWISFLGKGGGTLPAYLQPQGQIYQQLCMFMQQFNLNVEIIIAGADESKAHVAIITHPGILVLLDKLGYGAIGSGGMHANISLSLKGQSAKKKLPETLYNVYAAKRAAEAAPGVGQSTDMAVIENRKILYCGEPVLAELKKIYDTGKGDIPSFKELEVIYGSQRKS